MNQVMFNGGDSVTDEHLERAANAGGGAFLAAYQRYQSRHGDVRRPRRDRRRADRPAAFLFRFATTASPSPADGPTARMTAALSSRSLSVNWQLEQQSACHWCQNSSDQVPLECATGFTRGSAV